MKSRLFPICAAAIWMVLSSDMVLAAAQADAPAAGEEIEIQADSYEFNPDTGLGVGEGNVVAIYQDMKLTADHAEVNLKTKEVAAKGNVHFERGVFVWDGPSITGNFGTREFDFGEYRALIGVWYTSGAGATHSEDGTVELRDAQISTCEYYDHPHYSIRARRVVYYPDGDFVAYHTVYRIGRVPVFYFPVVFGDTDERGGNIEIKPGYDGDWGPYLLLGREWRFNQKLRTKMMLHLRGNRGVALGNRTSLKTDRSDSEILLYGMHDEDPPETEPDYNRRFDVESDRYRARFRHWQEVVDGLTLRGQVDAMSDIDMLEDWFRREYRNSPQPASIVDATFEAERFSLGISARPRVNDFYTVAESLPRLRLEMPRQPLFGTGIYYEGSHDVQHLEMKWRDFDKDRNPALTDPEDYDTWRADSLHMLYVPFRLWDTLQVVPRAGLRLTYYENTSRGAVLGQDLALMFDVDNPDDPDPAGSVTNYDDDGGSQLRVAGELGIELKTKLYRVWADARNPRWDVDGLRHIVEPYINYTMAPKPSEKRENLYFFDGVDRLIEQNFVRVGVNQRLQTRRNKEIYTLARLQNYADLHFAKEDEHHHLGDFGSRLEFNPKKTVSFWGTAIVDMGEPDFNRGQVGLTLGDRYTLSLAYSYRNIYLSRAAHSMGSSMFDFGGETSLLARDFERSHYGSLTLGFPLGDKMSGEIEYAYDFVENELALQSYELKRDLHCWVGALRFAEESGDLQFNLVLYLKAFPKVRIDTSM